MYLKMIEEECPICFFSMNEEDGILDMECCNKKIHIKCIVEWYSHHMNQKNCFICNQNNKFCQDLILRNDTDTLSEPGPSLNTTESNNILRGELQIITNQNSQDINLSRVLELPDCKKVYLYLCSFTGIGLIIIFTVITLYYTE